MLDVIQSCERAKAAKNSLLSLNSEQKSTMLDIIAGAILDNEVFILSQNERDIATHQNMAEHLVDRLRLNTGRLNAMAEGLHQLKQLPDPVGKVIDSWVNSSGLEIQKVRVPFGVIAIIYEARPNVTVDAIGLC